MSRCVTRRIKCVVVGDTDVGKTSLLSRFCRHVFPKDHVPTIFDDDKATVAVGDQCIELMLFDTTGQTEYDRLRVTTYPRTDVIILCFSVVRPQSLSSVVSRWLPELSAYCADNVPIVLVGTQTDLRPSASDAPPSPYSRPSSTSTSSDFVTSSQGSRAAKRIGAQCYVECSALTGVGLSLVFGQAAAAVLVATTGRQRRRRRATIAKLQAKLNTASSTAKKSAGGALSHVKDVLLCWKKRAA